MHNKCVNQLKKNCFAYYSMTLKQYETYVSTSFNNKIINPIKNFIKLVKKKFYKFVFRFRDDINKNYGNKQGMEKIKKYVRTIIWNMHCRSLAEAPKQVICNACTVGWYEHIFIFFISCLSS